MRRNLMLAGLCAAVFAALALTGAAATPGPTVPAGFSIHTIAPVSGARELAALPDGDLLVATNGRDVYLLPNAEAPTPGRPQVFAAVPDDLASGVAFSARRREIFIGTEHAVYVTAYDAGRRTAGPLRKIASVRTGPVAPNSDGDIHSTTSVAFSDPAGVLYVAVGSSCNACTETDPTRASIFQMNGDGDRPLKRATRIRNAIALAIAPETGALWAGDAGQDALAFGHPYEFLDDVTLHGGVADYGWPQCEENHRAYVTGADCAATVAPLLVLPAYSTIIGAVFYPEKPAGAFAFPSAYRGALFAAAHGSWHRNPAGGHAAVPQVVSVAMRNGRPATPVDWNDPRAQWHVFVGGFETTGERVGRPTGLAVGTQGSLFVGDDAAGVVYRVRPNQR
ncbi:MAG: hypothetical protein WB615_04025 [Candidatus Tumulicola sp.]